MRKRKIVLVAPPVNERSEDPDLAEIVIPTAWMAEMEDYPELYKRLSWKRIVDYMCEPEDHDFPFLTNEDYEKWEKKMGNLGIWTPNLREIDQIGLMASNIEKLKSGFGFDHDWVVVYDRNSFIERNGGVAILGDDEIIGRHEMLKVDRDESIRIDFDSYAEWSDTYIYIPKGMYYINPEHKSTNSGDCINFSKKKIFDLLKTK